MILVFSVRGRDLTVSEHINPFPYPTPLEVVLLQELAAAGRECYERGWCPGTAGNFSLRGKRSLSWVSRTSISKAQLSVRDFVPVSLETGDPVTPESPRASLEAAVHLAIYRLSPDARVVVHAHPPYTVARSAVDAEFLFRGAEIQKALGALSHEESLSIPLIANPTKLTLAHMQRELEAMTNLRPGVIVLRGHGVYAWGESPVMALDRLEALEFLCQTST